MSPSKPQPASRQDAESSSKVARGEGASALRTLSNDLAGAVERAARSIVAIHARPRIAASGVCWREGVIVAASHTIRRDRDIAITLPDGSRARGQLVGRDGGTDLAVLRLDETPSSDALSVAQRADADLRVGSLVLAVGRPGDDGVTASLGVVSAVGDRWRTWSGGEIDRFVRLDLTIYDGFSGGALVDGAGQIAGINCSALARGTPLTIPNSTVDRIVEALLTRGHVPRAYLGVAMQPVRLAPALADRLGLESPDRRADGARGVLIVMVEPDSPADQGGLFVGDVIVAIDGDAVGEPQEIAEHLSAERVGQRLELTLVRGGEKRNVSVTVGTRRAPEDVRPSRRDS